MISGENCLFFFGHLIGPSKHTTPVVRSLSDLKYSVEPGGHNEEVD